MSRKAIIKRLEKLDSNRLSDDINNLPKVKRVSEKEWQRLLEDAASE